MFFSFNFFFFMSGENDIPLKLRDTFMYLGSSISSTERNVNINIRKVWIIIFRLMTIPKTYLFDKIMRSFLQDIYLHHLVKNLGGFLVVLLLKRWTAEL